MTKQHLPRSKRTTDERCVCVSASKLNPVETLTENDRTEVLNFLKAPSGSHGNYDEFYPRQRNGKRGQSRQGFTATETPPVNWKVSL